MRTIDDTMIDTIRTPIDQVQAGAILDQPVYHKGRTLFAAGKTLTNDDIKELKQLNITSLGLREPEAIIGDKVQHDPLSDEFRNQAISTVRHVYEDFHNLDHRHAMQISLVSSHLLDEVRQATNLGVAVHDLRDYSNYTYQHSVNVTAISVAIGLRMGLGQEELSNLTTGGLLHDIGKMKIPLAILDKDGKLTDREFTLVRHHPEWGWDLLKERTEFPAVVWSIARQHHETLDGKGYPAKLRGSAIHELSRIVTVVDMWDALRSERPYKPAWNPDRVLAHLNSIEMVGKLDLEVLETFNALIVPYPIGSSVMITGGRVATVVGLNLTDYSRPILRFDDSGLGGYVDLMERKSLGIIKTLELAE
jgi:putative nucleotidyltransferase with HDIG domain